MKRVLEVLALTFLIVGVELSTGACSYVLSQLGKVYAELVLDAEPSVSLRRFFLGIVSLLIGMLILLLDIWARAGWQRVGSGKVCPQCGGITERVKRRRRHRLLGWVLGERVTRRACKTCDWSGLVS